MKEIGVDKMAQDSYDQMLKVVGQLYKDVTKAQKALAKARAEVATADRTAEHIMDRYQDVDEFSYEATMAMEIWDTLGSARENLDDATEMVDQAVDRLD